MIGVLREEPWQERPSTVPQPTLADIPRLVEETRCSGAKIDFEMQVDGAAAAPGPLGCDAYRIVQEALTNITRNRDVTAISLSAFPGGLSPWADSGARSGSAG